MRYYTSILNTHVNADFSNRLKAEGADIREKCISDDKIIPGNRQGQFVSDHAGLQVTFRL